MSKLKGQHHRGPYRRGKSLKHGSNEPKKRTTTNLKTRLPCGDCEENQIRDFI